MKNKSDKMATGGIDNDKYLVKDIIYKLCDADYYSTIVYRSLLLSVTMLSDDRINEARKEELNLDLSSLLAKTIKNTHKNGKSE